MRSEQAKAFVAWALALCAALALPGCGGTDGPDVKGPGTLVGRLLTTTGKSSLASTSVEVSVRGQPANRALVDGDGRFALNGLPERFDLVFMEGNTHLGTIGFDNVVANQQLTITVELDLSLPVPEAVLIREDRRGIGDTGVEIEQRVENVVTLAAMADSAFVIGGRTVIARAGTTEIRQEYARMAVGEILPGMRAHVTGISAGTDVLAYRMWIQGAAEKGSGSLKACHLREGSAARTLTIDSSAWPSHEAHGDAAGAC
jgi:hypothetical protein